MDKFNKFCEKYGTALWQLTAAIWFYVEFFSNQGIYSLLGAGVFWTVLAIIEFVRISIRKEPKSKETKGKK